MLKRDSSIFDVRFFYFNEMDILKGEGCFRMMLMMLFFSFLAKEE